MPRVAIVTGGASGIGAALGRALVTCGDDVVLADVEHDAAAHLADNLTPAGPGTARAALLDVRDAEQVDGLVQEVHGVHGRLDLMFNNAGIGLGGEPEELTLEHWDRMIDVNLRGVLHGCRAAYPLMKDQPRGGHIVNTASLGGLVPTDGGSAPSRRRSSASSG